MKVETKESFGAGQNWIFSYIWCSDKYGNIWKERPIKLVGIHNKQDNWKLPVRRKSNGIQSRSPFFYLIKQKLLIFINLWHLCLKRLAGANFMNINGLTIWKLKCLNFTAICHHNLGFSPLVKFVSVSSWQDLVSKYCDNIILSLGL